jgi:hypothetical protein
VDTTYPGLFAILDRADSLALAERERVRLIKPETVQLLHRFGHWIEPQTLPDASQRAAVPRLPGETRERYEARIRLDMSSLEWCVRHSFACWAELDASNWDGVKPVCFVGKTWVDHPTATIYGWPAGPYPSAHWLQPLQAAHGRPGRHKDYSSTSYYESDVEPTWIVPAFTPGDEQTPRVETPLERAISQLGVREATGRNDGEQIAKYFNGATRLSSKGTEQPTGWRSGWEWCAAFFGWCGWRTHRIAVHEYVSDGRRLGLYHPKDSGYVPKPGDGVIFARAGEDPEQGGQGHIARFQSYGHAGDGTAPLVYSPRFMTVGGNEENQVLHTKRTFADANLRGFLEA